MARVLILFAHPALEKSRVNRELAAAAREVPGVTFHDLYESYPDLHIHPRAEQARLVAHDVVVFQHPFYWYSSPAILKEWLDLVLEAGFAYGEKGTALRGKKWLSAITTGGPAEAYARDGVNYFTIRELLAPFEQTARLCGMEFLPPHVVHASSGFSKTKIAAAARTYGEYIAALCDESVASAAPPVPSIVERPGAATRLAS